MIQNDRYDTRQGFRYDNDRYDINRDIRQGPRYDSRYGTQASMRETSMQQVLESTVVMQQTLVESLRLPKCELQMFDGNPIKYYPFIHSLEANVHQETVSSVDRLARLQQFCSGEAKRVIESYSVMEPDLGYRRARELFYKRFGEPYTISEAWLEQIDKMTLVDVL